MIMQHKRARTRNRRSGRRGQSIVEMALSLAAMFVLVAGCIQLGTVIYSYEVITENARRAARNAVVNEFDETRIKNMVVYGNPAGTGSAYYGVTLEDVSVSMQDLDAVTSLLTIEVNSASGRFYAPVLGNIPTPRIRVTRVVEGLGEDG